VVALVLDKDLAQMDYDAAAHRISDIVDAGRTVCVQFWSHYKRALSDGEAIFYALVPRKSFNIGSQVLRTCRSIRESLVFSPSTADDDMSACFLCAYIGGGVPHQPPNTYAMVFKHMPLRVARRVLALLLYHTGSSVDASLFVCKHSNHQALQLSAEDTTERIALEVEQIHSFREALDTELVREPVQPVQLNAGIVDEPVETEEDQITWD
jgi:hypothetical protein